MSEWDVIIRDRKRRLQRARKSMVLPRKRYDDIGRRRGAPGAFIPYDLGRVKSGMSYAELDVNVTGKEFRFIDHGGGSIEWGPAPCVLSEIQAVENAVFDITDVSGLATNFYRILRSDGFDDEFYRFKLTINGA